jgi:hypothetical protein
VRTPNYQFSHASVEVSHRGKVIDQLETEVRSYKASQEQSSIIGIRRRLNEDLYINFLRISQDNTKAIFQLYVFPLVTLIWGSFYILLFGTIICLIPGKVRLQYARTEVVGIADAQPATTFSLKSFSRLAASLRRLCAIGPESYLTPDVLRVGSRLACRCGTCRNTVGDCPMLHCSYCSPIRSASSR